MKDLSGDHLSFDVAGKVLTHVAFPSLPTEGSRVLQIAGTQPTLV